MILLSILWRKTVLLSGYPDFMHVNEKGEELFKMDGAKIYKGRWMIDNTFSYPEKHDFVLSED